MKSVAKYRQPAEECRKLSDKLARPNDKHALELMARGWDSVRTVSLAKRYENFLIAFAGGPWVKLALTC
jgi:hypothetical protein